MTSRFHCQPRAASCWHSRYACRWHELPQDQRELGIQPLRLEHITGTQGQISFDRDFLPLQRRSKNRWISAAIAMLTDPISLPPIDMVQVGADYYVGDGNHRVSVAKALGNLYIDGEVTQWVLILPRANAARLSEN